MCKKVLFFCVVFLLAMSWGMSFADPMTPEKALVRLGKKIYRDKNLSINRNQSCKSCHHKRAGFADPLNMIEPSENVVSVGSDRTLTGGLNAPTAAYAGFSPKMYWDEEQELYIGGIFWNGRAHGHKAFEVYCLAAGYDDPVLHSPLAEQAQGPFTNPVEMALPDNDTVVERVTGSSYACLFDIAFSKVDFDDIPLTFDQIAVAIAAFEESPNLVKFSSRYDKGCLSEDQTQGLMVFEGEGNCAACHISTADPSGKVQFTDFSYDNLGLPLNPIIADKGVDPGLGGFIDKVLDPDIDYPESLEIIVENAQSVDAATPEANMGKHKVSTLRNISMTPPYGHNGFFPNLRSIVQFYNTRDVYTSATVPGGIPVTPALLAEGKIPGYPAGAGYFWPQPEWLDNVNMEELGNLGLSSGQVDKIVAFLEALTDE